MRRPALNLRAAIRPAIVSLFVVLLVSACNDTPGPLELVPTVTGTVTNSATGGPVAGAEVRIGDAATTTGANGRFELTDLATGTATLRCTAPGFVDFEADITVTSSSVTRDIGLARIEVFEFGDYALYVPASAAATRGLLLALGGPDTRGFSTGKPMGAPIPAVEASLQALGRAFRELAATHGLAVLGSSRAAMTNGPDSDQLLLDAVQTAAGMSGRPELPTAPMLVYGMSGGAPQASGFTARNPNRVAGLFLKVPVGVAAVTSGNTLGVPTYMVLAELDAFVDNAVLTAAFETNRRAGALWALAKEPAVPHHSLTPVQRQVTIDWISTILELRLPASPSGPLREIAEASGWLGDRVTGEVGPWANYPGDRALASWLPSQAAAEQWEALVGPGSGPGVNEARLRVLPIEAQWPTVDVFVDDIQVLNDMTHLTASDYLEVAAGSRIVRFHTDQGDDEARVNLAAGADYTAIPCCTSFPASFVLTDDNSAPGAGNAKVRVVHLAGAGDVDIYLTAPGVDLAAERPTSAVGNWGDASDYIGVPAGDYEVRATLAGTKTVVIRGTLTLVAGQVRTALTVDAVGGGEPFEFLVLEDLN
jgi:hypothetical protein